MNARISVHDDDDEFTINPSFQHKNRHEGDPILLANTASALYFELYQQLDWACPGAILHGVCCASEGAQNRSLRLRQYRTSLRAHSLHTTAVASAKGIRNPMLCSHRHVRHHTKAALVEVRLPGRLSSDSRMMMRQSYDVSACACRCDVPRRSALVYIDAVYRILAHGLSRPRR